MFGEQDGQVARAVQRQDRRDHRLGPRRVELRSRLVQQQQPRLERQHRRDRDALAFAPGERGQPAVPQVLDPERAQQNFQAPPHLRDGDPVLLHSERDLVLDRLRHGLRLWFLEHEPRHSRHTARRGRYRIEPRDS